MNDYMRFCSVTLPVLNMISDVKLEHSGDSLDLKNEDGSPNIRACMYLLGFSKRRKSTQVFTIEKDECDRSENLLVRDTKIPSRAYYTKLYSGKLRRNYTPVKGLEKYLKKVVFDGDIMKLKEGGSDFYVEVGTFGRALNY